MSRLLLLVIALAPSLTALGGDGRQGVVSEAARKIDALLERSWGEDSITTAGRAGDAEFCRRVWLDLVGVAPPIYELRSFLAETDPGKRERLVARLLSSSRYASHMANRWNEVLLPPDALDNRQGNALALNEWLREQFQANRPYDHFVGAFLTAGGKSDQGPAIFYTSRNVEPVKVAAATSKIFLGVQLQCAECHDHPFGRWSQEDFWSFAAFFSQLEMSDARMGGAGFIEDRRGREVTLPDSDRVMPPRYPGISELPEEDPSDFRRRQLTIWLASRDNIYFARAAVNRAWAHLFGRGIVDPVDEMDDDNPPSHPELLAFLADYFVQIKFDLRMLYATLAQTKAYHLSSAVDGERPPADSFAAMTVKTLSAEQYFDSLNQNVFFRSLPPASEQQSQVQLSRNQFLARMRVAGSSAEEYPLGVVQALGMMNGPEMFTATNERQSGLIGSLEAPFFSDEDRIETLFLACLSRLPTGDENELFRGHLQGLDDPQEKRTRMADLAWTLLNTAECFVCP